MEWMLMPLKRYAEFNGRSRRQEFWMYMLLLLAIWVVEMIVMMIIGASAFGMASSASDPSAAAGGLAGMMASMGIILVLFGIVGLALFIPTLAVQIRRLHDQDKTGWFVMLFWGPYIIGWLCSMMGIASQSQGLAMIGGIFSLIGLIGMIVLIVFYCLPGTRGPNKFGPDPLGGAGNLGQTFQ